MMRLFYHHSVVVPLVLLWIVVVILSSTIASTFAFSIVVRPQQREHHHERCMTTTTTTRSCSGSGSSLTTLHLAPQQQQQVVVSPLVAVVKENGSRHSPSSLSLHINNRHLQSRNDWFRQLCYGAGALVGIPTMILPDIAVAATSSSLQKFQDETHGFVIGIPSSWISREETLFDRRTLRIWTDPTDPSTSLFIAYTPIRDDFTSLNSFGTVDQVAAQTILPKSNLMDEKNNDGISATMISATSALQSYLFDYTQQTKIQPLTHYRTIFTLAPGATGGAGAVLVTITAQTPQERYLQIASTFDDIIKSYGKL